jgi:hypothetical protein
LETLELLPEDQIEYVDHDGMDVVVVEEQVYNSLEKDMKWVSL